MDRFERIDKLGEGGQGKVYKVRKKATGEIVVLKMINCSDPTFATLAEREIEVMKACVHPHIIEFQESFRHHGKSGNWVCLVMEYCSGGDLFSKFKNAVQQKRKFEEAQITSWICQIAAGLQYMHEKDLWHRDIKAANILFNSKGILKLGDFGLSSSYNPNGHKTVVGTPFYFAPEIMLNQKYSNKVDIWNLGVLMLELLTFKQIPVNVEVLRNDKMHAKIMQSIQKEGYSKRLAMLVSSMLSRLPDDRPSAREILQQTTHEDDGVVMVPEREFGKSEALLRETLAAHPLFAKGAKKAAESSQKKIQIHPRSKTPPNNGHHPKTLDDRKRVTLVEGDIQRLIAQEEERQLQLNNGIPSTGGVRALAHHYDRAGATATTAGAPTTPIPTNHLYQKHAGTPPAPRPANSPPQTHNQWGTTRSPHTVASPAPPAHLGSPPFRSPQMPGTPGMAGSGGSGSTGGVKSPTSPIASPRQQTHTGFPQHQQHQGRKVTNAGVAGWPNHPRSPIANEPSGGSGGSGSGWEQQQQQQWASPTQKAHHQGLRGPRGLGENEMMRVQQQLQQLHQLQMGHRPAG